MEQIMLRAARAHAVVDDPTAHQPSIGCAPSTPCPMHPSNLLGVFWRLTDNPAGTVCVRFVVPTAGFARSRTRSPRNPRRPGRP